MVKKGGVIQKWMRLGLTAILVATLYVSFPTLTRADTLDWGTGAGQANWNVTTAPYTQTFTVNGINITVAITGNTNRFYNTGPGGTPPDDDTSLGSGLYLAANYNNTAENLVITVTFSRQVSNIAFTIFDVDKSPSGNPFEDEIRNISSSNLVTTYYATATGSVANTVSGSGSTLAITGDSVSVDGTTDGNTTITFADVPVQQFTFTWGSGPGAPANPLQQWITLGDITYTVVPEPSTYLIGFLLVGLIGFHALRKRLIS